MTYKEFAKDPTSGEKKTDYYGGLSTEESSCNIDGDTTKWVQITF